MRSIRPFVLQVQLKREEARPLTISSKGFQSPQGGTWRRLSRPGELVRTQSSRIGARRTKQPRSVRRGRRTRPPLSTPLRKFYYPHRRIRGRDGARPETPWQGGKLE